MKTLTIGETIYEIVDEAARSSINTLIDPTLTQEGKAADAKIVGDNIDSLLSDMEVVSVSINNMNQQINVFKDEVNTLSKKVDDTMTEEEIKQAIDDKFADGVVGKVTTNSGTVLDDNGLVVSKPDSEIKTEITEDGVSVYKNNGTVFTADNSGVNATNLHATTYLTIGTNSRFADYMGNRTGCFWIGVSN